MKPLAGNDNASSLIRPEEIERIRKSANQLASYTNFLRWSANFRKDELVRHPNHDRIMMLSPMQSGRFSFSYDEDAQTLYLGVQTFEAAWISCMPFDGAYVSDRLYLSVTGVACMESKIPPLALGIFIDESRKRHLMSKAAMVQPMRVFVKDGKVEEVGELLGDPITMLEGDIIRSLSDEKAAKLKQQDIGRFL